jgi:hypothetical protein
VSVKISIRCSTCIRTSSASASQRAGSSSRPGSTTIGTSPGCSVGSVGSLGSVDAGGSGGSGATARIESGAGPVMLASPSATSSSHTDGSP